MGSVIAASLGGLPCTSYTQNVGIIATTGVASRVVVQVAGAILLLYGLCPKLGALLVALPRSVLGAVFVVVCGAIVLSGSRLILQAPLDSAGATALGITLVVSNLLPHILRESLGADWLEARGALLGLLLSNSVVLAVILGIGLNLLASSVGSGRTGAGRA